MFRPIPKDHPALLRKKIKVASVAIDLDAEFALDSNNQHAELPDDISTGDPMVISIGRLHPDKGHEFAIQAWAQVIREMPAAKLSIVGKGKDELRLKKLTQSLDLTDQVVFISYLESLAPLFQHADIYLAPSINEGTNLTSMQAMAAGLAVIGFNNEVDYEIIRHGQNGILVAQKNVQELAQAIIKLSKDKILRSKLEHNARQTINQIYHLQDVISYHQQIYTAAAKAEPLESILDMR
ncbi:MAG: glycosyltransferase family 4 protein [Chloroflexi bacterium]|nr:glycosyltransferase family 4 protein [Chloroflexota bacterium]